jgi:hypothetical protein
MTTVTRVQGFARCKGVFGSATLHLMSQYAPGVQMDSEVRTDRLQSWDAGLMTR